jgi:protein-S-isoprenylcysteine O-methyltransferase Ste14
MKTKLQILETKVPAPVVAALLGLSMKAYVVSGGVLVDPSLLRMQLGVGLSQLSGLLVLAALAGMAWARTTINPVIPARASRLVTGGVYRWSRNPMYLSLLMLLVAYAVRIESPAVWLAPVAFVAYVTRFQILPEERVLAQKFGGAYQDYRQRTRRWI